MAVGVVLHLFQWKKKKPKRSLTQIMALIRSGQTFKMGGHVFNEQPGGKRTPNEDGDAEMVVEDIIDFDEGEEPGTSTALALPGAAEEADEGPEDAVVDDVVEMVFVGCRAGWLALPQRFSLRAAPPAFTAKPPGDAPGPLAPSEFEVGVTRRFAGAAVGSTTTSRGSSTTWTTRMRRGRRRARWSAIGARARAALGRLDTGRARRSRGRRAGSRGTGARPPPRRPARAAGSRAAGPAVARPAMRRRRSYTRRRCCCAGHPTRRRARSCSCTPSSPRRRARRDARVTRIIPGYDA
jgi:hypothetical protein